MATENSASELLKELNRQETQRFAIFNVLVTHAMQTLTPDKLDEIMSEIVKEMRTSPSSWAFN